MKTPAIDFTSADARFRVHAPGWVVARILRLCRRAGERETGGILVGTYTSALDCARISQVSGPPPDSRSGPTWFHGGYLGLKEWIARRWSRSRDHYLGEWHFHPGGAPVPSPDDREQLRYISKDAAYCCPEPVLLILGGDPAGRWSLSAHVFPRGKEIVVLSPGRLSE